MKRINIIESINENTIKVINPTILICTYNKDFMITKSIGDSGFDLRVAETVDISKKVVLIPTGVKICMPLGIEGQIRPRSGLASKYGKEYCIANSPGTDDSDYRGEIKVIMDISNSKNLLKEVNLGDKSSIGIRIAQIVFSRIENFPSIVYDSSINFVKSVDKKLYKNFEIVFPSIRGSNGFGFSGK